MSSCRKRKHKKPKAKKQTVNTKQHDNVIFVDFESKRQLSNQQNNVIHVDFKNKILIF